MEKTFSITIDMEQDFGGRIDSYRGVKEALPKLLTLLRKHKIHATFFVNGKILNLFPEIVKGLWLQGHEVASHGYEHIKLKERSETEVRVFFKLTRAQFDKIGMTPVGFRSPYLAPNKVMPLIENGFFYDSSLTNAFFPGRYCGLHLPTNPFVEFGCIQFPVSRLPWSVFAFTLLQADTLYCLSWYSSLEHTTMFFHLHDLLIWDDISFLHGMIRMAYKNKRERFDLLEKIILKNKDKRFVTLKEKMEEVMK